MPERMSVGKVFQSKTNNFRSTVPPKMMNIFIKESSISKLRNCTEQDRRQTRAYLALYSASISEQTETSGGFFAEVGSGVTAFMSHWL